MSFTKLIIKLGQDSRVDEVLILRRNESYEEQHGFNATRYIRFDKDTFHKESYKSDYYGVINDLDMILQSPLMEEKKATLILNRLPEWTKNSTEVVIKGGGRLKMAYPKSHSSDALKAVEHIVASDLAESILQLTPEGIVVEAGKTGLGGKGRQRG